MKKSFLSISGFVVLGAFVCLLASGIHRKTSRAVAPPVYDPLGYIQKGHSIWGGISSGSITNPLNAEPPSRPPGCVPFSYPFGYTPSVNSFLFWNTLSPVALWLLALWLAFKTRIKTAADHGSALALCIGLASLPMFYHFEVNPAIDTTWSGEWGLVDCLLAALAALAASLMAKGAQIRSVKWSVLGWMVSAYTLLIKPAGLLVMIIIAWIWAVEMLLYSESGVETPRRRFWSYFWPTIFWGGLIYALTAIACFSSQYLSATNLAAGVEALRILRLLYTDQSWMNIAVTYIRPGIGWQWFIPLLLLFFGGLFRSLLQLARRNVSRAQLRLLAALLALLGAGVWWVAIAGMQARYFYPFILLVLAWSLPDAIPLISRLNLIARTIVTGLCLGQGVLLVVLLWWDHPPVSLQHNLGYNLSTGGYGGAVDIAKKMISESRAAGKQTIIYAGADFTCGVIHAVDLLEFINFGRPMALEWIRPVDWVREPGIRYADLMSVDCILQEDHGSSGMPTDSSRIETINQEMETYMIWLKSLDEKDGVTSLGNDRLIYLKITDKVKLAAAFRKFTSRFVWRSEFIRNNPEIFPAK